METFVMLGKAALLLKRQNHFIDSFLEEQSISVILINTIFLNGYHTAWHWRAR
jgi:hypothetical protein